LTELQRSSFNAQDAAQYKLREWLRGIMNDMQEVPVNRILVKTALCLTGRSVIPNCVHPKELNLDWLNKINFKSASTDLELLQRNIVMERENKQLRKDLLEKKLLLLEYKTATEAKLEEARKREEKLIRSNEEFKQEMKEQAKQTKRIMQPMTEMFQKQAQP